MASRSTVQPSCRASSRSRPRSCPAPTSSTRRSCAGQPFRPPRRSTGRSSPRARNSFQTAWRRGPLFARRTPRWTASGTDDKLLGISRRHLRTELDLVVTAQQVRSYKPDPTHLRECARRIGGKKGWVHIASGYETDVGPALKLNVPTIWVNRHGEKLEGRKAPDATVKNVREAAAKLGAK